MRKRRPVLVGFVAGVLTLLATLLALNLSLGDKQIDWKLPHQHAVDSPQFPRTLGHLLGPPLVGGNRVEALVNGDRIFPAMLAAIADARRSIAMETYIYWSGEIGARFATALAERARTGVKVHVLLDWVGSNRIDLAYIEQMKSAGVEITRYNKPHWHGLDRVNNRTHRKLLVVDGKIGFTGGVGIADQWLGDATRPDQWRDTHFRVEGPVVAQLQAAFLDNWVQATGNVPYGDDYFPALSPAGGEGGNMQAQMFTSSPGGGSESMQLMYLLSLASATRSVRLSMSYFVPDDVAIDTLVAALERGVQVQIIVPGPLIDVAVVRRASRARWGRLLAAGVQIYEYMPTMYHCKVMIVDERWVSVGSTNFDNRSFAVNDEANLNVLDAQFAQRQVAIFEDDLRHARRITLEEWQTRPWRERIVEWMADKVGSQL
jgi:cardiolipin synthase A/B